MKPPVLHLSKHTGMVIAFVNKSYKLQGDPATLKQAYVECQKHCLLFGWWSVFSLFLINPACILLNAYNWSSYKKKYVKFIQFQGVPQNPVGI